MEQQQNENSHASAQSRAGGANLTDVLAAAQLERDCYKAALEEIWATYINAGIYPISSGTLAYIAKDALAANRQVRGGALLRRPA